MPFNLWPWLCWHRSDIHEWAPFPSLKTLLGMAVSRKWQSDWLYVWMRNGKFLCVDLITVRSSPQLTTKTSRRFVSQVKHLNNRKGMGKSLVLSIDCLSYFSQRNTPLTRGRWKCFHVNIRSVQKKSNKIFTLFGLSNWMFNVIMFSETWYKNDTDRVVLPGYQHLFLNRKNNREGGVSIHVKQKIKY